MYVNKYISNIYSFFFIKKKGMRIKQSVAHLSNRIAKDDTYLGDTFIPKGTLITICLNDLMNNPTKWNNPDEFNIDRFLPNSEETEGVKYAPFSYGSRTCVGLNFAMAEIRTVLLMLLRKYSWTLPKDSIHKNGVISKGLNFAGPDNLELDFVKRY
ncbi:cytochrome P450 [Backusella circina FSU 941]|nr:cytochrome P450 [Backusella circina FSU 941]